MVMMMMMMMMGSMGFISKIRMHVWKLRDTRWHHREVKIPPPPKKKKNSMPGLLGVEFWIECLYYAILSFDYEHFRSGHMCWLDN